MKTILLSILSALLIILFTYAAWSKALGLELFRHQLYLQPLPHSIAGLLLYLLPVTEFLIALLLCFRQTFYAALLSSFFLLLAFTIYIALILLHVWDKAPCPCGGILSHMSWTSHLIFNSAFLLVNLWGLVLYRRHRTISIQ